MKMITPTQYEKRLRDAVAALRDARIDLAEFEITCKQAWRDSGGVVPDGHELVVGYGVYTRIRENP